jgi:DNA polymerase alpha subunit B
MADSDVEELNALLATPGIELETDVIAELQSIMRLHSISPRELFYKWESYSIKMGFDDLKLNIDTARALKKDVQEGLEREVRSKTHIRSAEKRGGTPRNVSNATGVFDMYVQNTPLGRPAAERVYRLDGLVPNNPRAGSANRTNGTNKRKLETPSTSRVKAEPASSPPDFKTPYKPRGQPNGTKYDHPS